MTVCTAGRESLYHVTFNRKNTGNPSNTITNNLKTKNKLIVINLVEFKTSGNQISLITYVNSTVIERGFLDGWFRD